MRIRILVAIICLGLVHCAHQSNLSSLSNDPSRPPESLVCVRVEGEQAFKQKENSLTLQYVVQKDSVIREKTGENFSYRCSPKQVKPLPTWRKGVGGAAIAVGGMAIVLGIAHMIVPVFKTAHGCNAMGVDSECVADRYGTGIPLVVGGTLLGGLGGGFALGYPW